MCKSQNSIYRGPKLMCNICNHLITLFMTLLNFYLCCPEFFFCFFLLYYIMYYTKSIAACILRKSGKICNNRKTSLVFPVCHCFKTDTILMTYKVYTTVFDRHASPEYILNTDSLIHIASKISTHCIIFFTDRAVCVKIKYHIVRLAEQCFVSVCACLIFFIHTGHLHYSSSPHM